MEKKSSNYAYNKEYAKTYLKKKVDEIKVRCPKGKKEIIQAHADEHDGGSMNAFINRAINETMERDKENDA